MPKFVVKQGNELRREQSPRMDQSTACPSRPREVFFPVGTWNHAEKRLKSVETMTKTLHVRRCWRCSIRGCCSATSGFLKPSNSISHTHHFHRSSSTMASARTVIAITLARHRECCSVAHPRHTYIVYFPPRSRRSDQAFRNTYDIYSTLSIVRVQCEPLLKVYTSATRYFMQNPSNLITHAHTQTTTVLALQWLRQSHTGIAMPIALAKLDKDKLG